MSRPAMWGVHNDALSAELVETGFVNVGWDEIGSLKEIGNDRTCMKVVVERAYPEAEPGATPVWAGILLCFAFEMQVGDLAIAPYKLDGTLNFGRVIGEYEFHPEVEEHYHRRRVEWLRTGVPRGISPQKALYEIGSALTLFRVKNNVAAFLAYLDQQPGAIEETPRLAAVDEEPEHLDEWAADEPSAGKLHQYTEDFVRKTLLEELSHEEFEYFVADLLRALGHQAWVSPYVADGGVDVVAHKDSLGLEPPLLKVQCKHTAAVQSRPDVQRLIGARPVGNWGSSSPWAATAGMPWTWIACARTSDSSPARTSWRRHCGTTRTCLKSGAPGCRCVRSMSWTASPRGGDGCGLDGHC
ncbi:restriction endonuclease [Kocuria sp. M1R5S2]|uniref:restriction endonuclease n=1 Tax=Kocuria rhizosphaerae TaxID=3376285 RepID=UPI0037B9BB6E